MENLAIKLSKSLDKAKKNGDKVFFNVYNEWDREDGTPHRKDFDLNDWEILSQKEYDEWVSPEVSDFMFCPSFEGDGCTDLVIVDKNNQYFYVYYHDDNEDIIYESELDTYLQDF